jgi:arsenate reductase (thioredoxin)
MTDRIHNVLFLCSGNSARSVIGEAILNSAGNGQFKVFSAGTDPKGEINPHTVELLRAAGHDVADLRCKSWDEFAQPGAPPLDFVITVCDDAAGETCPAWPGEPLLAHWGVPDPAATKGSAAEIAAVFDETYGMMKRRIDLLLALPVAKLDKMVLASHLKEIGQSEGVMAKSA